MKVYVVITESQSDCNMYFMLDDTVKVFKTKKSAVDYYNQELNKVIECKLIERTNGPEIVGEEKQEYIDSAPIQFIELDLLH